MKTANVGKRVVFVCLGNICRSPAAHAVVQHRLAERGLAEAIHLDSAGTGDWHVGELPHRQSRAEGARRGYAVDHVVRQVAADDFARSDLIVAMDHANRTNLRALASRQRNVASSAAIVLLRSFDPFGGPDTALDDPYGKSDADFAAMYDIIERCADPLIDSLIDSLIDR